MKNIFLHSTFYILHSARRAFTIVETLIVIGITALLAGFVLTYTSTGREQIAVSVEQAKLSQTISRAKALTVSTYNQPEIPCGYGVFVDYPGRRYTLFRYGAPPCGAVQSVDPGQFFAVRTEILPSFVEFREVGESMEYILFTPPDPRTSIWRLGSGSATSTNAMVFLEGRSGVHEASVEVNSSGQVSF